MDINGKIRGLFVAREVAKAFVPGDQTLTVNHKDRDKLNNCVDNLEWITFSENHVHWRRTPRRSQ